MDRATYHAEVMKLNARPPAEDLPNQKFKRGWRVKVDDNMPGHMSHFESGFTAIVKYSYGQKFRTESATQYCLLQLDKNDVPCNSIAWYSEDQLTFVSNDIPTGLDLIETWDNRDK